MRAISLSFALAGVLFAPAAVRAGSQTRSTRVPRKAAKSRLSDAEVQRRREFDRSLKTEEDEFKKQQKAERDAYRATLTGKKPDQKKAAWASFRAGQQEKLKAFRVGQRQKRADFVGAQPAN